MLNPAVCDSKKDMSERKPRLTIEVLLVGKGTGLDGQARNGISLLLEGSKQFRMTEERD